jgi:acyl-CoA reductase LuxC
VEKIVAWGGFASVKHVTRYIQPGLELISLDPKRSASIIGPDAFESEASMRDAAVRLATDIGATNQNGCVNARVIYAMSGTDDHGLSQANKLGQYVYEAMLALPTCVSTKPKRYDRALKENVDAIRLDGDWYNVIGGRDDEGAIIVSQVPEPVAFSTALNDRTANIVPVDELSEVLGAVNSWTQTVGIYPEGLKEDLKDVIPLYGAQRLVSLGYAAASAGTNAGRQDAIEPMRRMGKWIVNEVSSPDRVPPLWTL